MWEQLIPAAASLVSGFLTQEGQENTNVANATQAAQQMEFQREMSSTSYQRAVTDMKAAGLNPMLAYQQGGASTPGGAMARMENAVGAGVSSAQIGSKIAPEIENLRAVTAKTVADTDKSHAEADLARSQALVNAVMVPRHEQETRTSASSAGKIEHEAERLREENRYGYPFQSVRELQHRGTRAFHEGERTKEFVHHGGPSAEIEEMIQRARLLSFEGTHSGLGLRLARNREEAQKSWWMRNVSPYLSDTVRSVTSGLGLQRILR